MYRGKYTIPAAGDGKHEAELLIWTVTNESDLKGAVSELTGSFEGEGVAPREESFDGGAGTKVALTTVSGTYRFPMGPPMGKKGKRAAHVLKPEWRGAIAAVSAGDKGRWIFRIVGPEDTVRNAEGAFRALLLGLK